MKTIILSIVITLLTIFSVIAFSTVEKTAPFNTYSTSISTSVNISGRINISGFPSLARTGENVTSHVINVTILNKSSLTGAYGILASSLSLVVSNATNGTTGPGDWNFTASLTEERHWLLLNFTNATPGGALTNVTVIEIDVDYDIMTIGQSVINFSIKTGNINISGILSADGGIVSGGTFTLNSNLLVTSTPLNITNTGTIKTSGDIRTDSNVNVSGVVKANSIRLANLSSSGLPACNSANIGDLMFSGHNLTFWGCDSYNWLNLSVS